MARKAAENRTITPANKGSIRISMLTSAQNYRMSRH